MNLCVEMSSSFDNMLCDDTMFSLFVLLLVLGSIPTGLVLSFLLYDTDPREHGSGNIGMTNVWRVLGAPAGLATLCGDLGKGVLGVWIASSFVDPSYLGWAALCLVIGHCYSIFLDFSGGKGVATAGGSLLMLDPWVFTLVSVVWIGVNVIGRKSSLSALIAALLLPVIVCWLEPQYFWPILTIVVIIVWRHQDNILRLKMGEE